MTVDRKHLTYQEYLGLPEMKARYSIIDGELVTDGAPTPDHQTVLQELFVKLDSLMRALRLGRVLLAPLDIVIQRDPLRTRQPDLMFISAERAVVTSVDHSADLTLAEVIETTRIHRVAALTDGRTACVKTTCFARPTRRLRM